VIVTVTPNPVLDRSLTVERILFDEVTRASAVQLDWGGKGFNVSRAGAAGYGAGERGHGLRRRGDGADAGARSP